MSQRVEGGTGVTVHPAPGQAEVLHIQPLAVSLLMAGLIGALIVAACSGSGAPSSSLTVHATEFQFEPATIRLVANQPARILLVNAGQLEHDLEIQGLSARGIRASTRDHAHGAKVAAHAQPGKQAWVEFTPTAKGTYEVICTIAGHKEAGMRGSFNVD